MMKFSEMGNGYDSGSFSGLGRFRPRPIVGGQIPTPILRPRPILGSMKKGGKIKRTGLYQLHKGEKVVPLKAKVRATMRKDTDKDGE